MSYSTLNSYNYYSSDSCQRPMAIRAPQTAMAVQLVPVYGAPGYDALNYGSCEQGHVEISRAYPSTCDRFVSRLCDGTLPSGPVQPTGPPRPFNPYDM